MGLSTIDIDRSSDWHFCTVCLCLQQRKVSKAYPVTSVRPIGTPESPPPLQHSRINYHSLLIVDYTSGGCFLDHHMKTKPNQRSNLWSSGLFSLLHAKFSRWAVSPPSSSVLASCVGTESTLLHASFISLLDR